jgi:hypothetical protein
MRIVESPNEFVESFLGAQREAAASFGINTILLEKYITQPRHIEVQVLLFFIIFVWIFILSKSSSLFVMYHKHLFSIISCWCSIWILI